MHASLAYALCAILCANVVIARFISPMASPTRKDAYDMANGWSPMPTGQDVAFPFANDNGLLRRAFTRGPATCGWINEDINNPISCSSGYYCGYNTVFDSSISEYVGRIGCCSSSLNPTSYTGCVFNTACFDSATGVYGSSQLACAGAYPYCIDYTTIADGTTYNGLGCTNIAGLAVPIELTYTNSFSFTFDFSSTVPIPDPVSTPITSSSFISISKSTTSASTTPTSSSLSSSISISKSTTPAPTTPSPSQTSAPPSGGLSAGAKAGIGGGVGGAVALGALILLAFICFKRRRRQTAHAQGGDFQGIQDGQQPGGRGEPPQMAQQQPVYNAMPPPIYPQQNPPNGGYVPVGAYGSMQNDQYKPMPQSNVQPMDNQHSHFSGPIPNGAEYSHDRKTSQMSPVSTISSNVHEMQSPPGPRPAELYAPAARGPTEMYAPSQRRSELF